MATVASIKSKFLRDIWLPLTIIGGTILYPRLRKNKKMKVFTLTDESNCEEITVFIGEKLTTKDRVVAWTSTIWKKARLESSLPITVLGSTRFEDSMTNSRPNLLEYIPFDILNLDFSSQNCQSYQGRLEKEIKTLELVMKLQRDRMFDKKGFVLFYTTLLNSETINCADIKRNSDDLRVPNWGGLNITNLPATAVDHQNKLRIIEAVFNHFSQKHRFSVTEKKIRVDPIGNERLCSVAGVFKVV